MKKIFATLTIVATLILSASCTCTFSSKSVEPAVDSVAVELVDSTAVAVDSVAVAPEVVAE